MQTACCQRRHSIPVRVKRVHREGISEGRAGHAVRVLVAVALAVAAFVRGVAAGFALVEDGGRQGVDATATRVALEPAELAEVEDALLIAPGSSAARSYTIQWLHARF